MARGRGKLTPQDKEDMKVFSANLNSILSDRNCKQAELSRATGIPPSTLTGYVKGTSLPIPGNVQKIADFFGVPKSTLDPRFVTANPVWFTRWWENHVIYLSLPLPQSKPSTTN